MNIELKLNKLEIKNLARMVNDIYQQIGTYLPADDPVSRRFFRYELQELQKTLVKKMLLQGKAVKLTLKPPAVFALAWWFNELPLENFHDPVLVREIISTIYKKKT